MHAYVYIRTLFYPLFYDMVDQSRSDVPSSSMNNVSTIKNIYNYIRVYVIVVRNQQRDQTVFLPRCYTRPSTLLSSSPVIIRKIWFVHYKLKSVWYLRVHTRKGKGKCVSPEGWECGWLVLWMSVWGGGNSKCSVNEVGNNRGLSSVTQFCG